jgi:hypothetical protein
MVTITLSFKDLAHIPLGIYLPVLQQETALADYNWKSELIIGPLAQEVFSGGASPGLRARIETSNSGKLQSGTNGQYGES